MQSHMSIKCWKRFKSLLTDITGYGLDSIISVNKYTIYIKGAQQNNNFLISQPKRMLWELKKNHLNETVLLSMHLNETVLLSTKIMC